MGAKKSILAMPYVPLVLATTAVWFGGATYWYVCQTQELCGSEDTSVVEEVKKPEVEDVVIIPRNDDHDHDTDTTVDHVHDTSHDHDADTDVDHNHDADADVDHVHDHDHDKDVVTEEPPIEAPVAEPAFDTSQTVTALYTANQAAFASTGWEKQMTEIATYLKENPTETVEVAGYAANVTNDTDEDSLSRRRAEALADFLIEDGVSKEQVVVTVKAYNEPVGDNSTEAGRAQNRRAVLSFK